jgi:hypothetical protein
MTTSIIYLNHLVIHPHPSDLVLGENTLNHQQSGKDVSFDITLGILLIKIKKSRGPRIDPWATPEVTGRKLDEILLITTLCLLLVK